MHCQELNVYAAWYDAIITLLILYEISIVQYKFNEVTMFYRHKKTIDIKICLFIKILYSHPVSWMYSLVEKCLFLYLWGQLSLRARKSEKSKSNESVQCGRFLSIGRKIFQANQSAGKIWPGKKKYQSCYHIRNYETDTAYILIVTEEIIDKKKRWFLMKHDMDLALNLNIGEIFKTCIGETDGRLLGIWSKIISRETNSIDSAKPTRLSQ